jgi:hypothetical protein
MSDAPLPETWDAGVRWLLGTTIVFALGFEGVTMLLAGKFILGSGSVFLALGLTAFIVYWPSGGSVILLMAGLPILLFLGTVEFCKRYKFKGPKLLIIGMILLVAAVALAGIGGALVFVHVSKEPPQITSNAVPPTPPAVIGFTQQQVDERVAEALKGHSTPDPTPKAHVYPDKTDAKEALENLHDVLVKKVQRAIAIFPKIDLFTLQRSLEQAVRNRFNLMLNRPGQTENPDPKQVRTEAIKGFLNNHLAAITDESTKLGEAQNAIYEIRAKQKAITSNNTEEFFALADPPQAFNNAQGSLVMALRYVVKQDMLETDVLDAVKAKNERTKFSEQINRAITRIAEEISAIEAK